MMTSFSDYSTGHIPTQVITDHGHLT